MEGDRESAEAKVENAKSNKEGAQAPGKASLKQLHQYL